MLALDIWAGNTIFGKNIKKLNPEIKTVFCWDPIFERQKYDLSENILFNINIFLSKFSKVFIWEEIQNIIEKSKTWVFKIVAEYKKIPIENNSLDILTLNSPHPLIYPEKKSFDEFRRVLKTGWIFYFGHSWKIHLDFIWNDFEMIGEWEFHFWEKNIAQIPNTQLQFPMSPVMKNNLITMVMMQNNKIKNSSFYIYWNGLRKIPIQPNWKAWKKII